MAVKIVKLICAPARTGFFFDDQLAIKSGAECDGFTYRGRPMLPGFREIRQAGEAVSILLQLENGLIAHGDCAAVQYSGVGGRDAVLYCRSQGIGAYLGGSCNETDRSAQVCVHIAMATGPDQMLAKPGMGMDEGYMILFNEMSRILALRSGI
jgi:methylaspartate ammonia-lyase